MNQEVSNLAKEFQNIMHLLQSHTSTFHCSAPASAFVPMMASPSVTAPLSISTGLHLHHDVIPHPPRNLWGCTSIPSQVRSPTLLTTSRQNLHMSPCMCHSDRDGNRVHNQCYSSPTTHSPYVTQRHAGPSLLGITSAFNNYSMQAGYNNVTIPTVSMSRPMCSSGNHSPLTINTDTADMQRSQTPIHSSLTPTGQPHFHTAFSPLSSSGAQTAAAWRRNSQGAANGPVRQNNPIGSSPRHVMQGPVSSLLGLVTDHAQNMTENVGGAAVEVQAPLFDLDKNE